jgi:vacuolar iron transporter family protein
MRLGSWVLRTPNPRRAVLDARTIAGAYIVGGFIPPGAYVVRRSDSTALTVSAITTIVALAGFGYIKGLFMDAPQVRSAIQTVLIIRPAAVAFMIARAIS